jgi:indolepyruvate ferredoxin oxidoreductase
VARYLFKLMAYKDEYEVARLHTEAAFAQQIAGCSKARSACNTTWRRRCWPDRTRRASWSSRSYGPWMHGAMKLLARMKGLRGGALDIFGRSAERRTERALIGEYEDCIANCWSH